MEEVGTLDDVVVERLETILAVLKLAHREEIESTRGAIRSDKVNAAILDGAKRWVGAGKLKSAVMKKTGAGSTTVRDRIADLLELGVLAKQGGGPTIEYKATGLI